MCVSFLRLFVWEIAVGRWGFLLGLAFKLSTVREKPVSVPYVHIWMIRVILHLSPDYGAPRTVHYIHAYSVLRTYVYTVHTGMHIMGNLGDVEK